MRRQEMLQFTVKCLAQIEAERATELVPPEDGCTCGERRVYELVWCGPDGSPFVECQSCGREFIPGEVAR